MEGCMRKKIFALVLCSSTQAQQPQKIPRIGLLLPYSASTAASWQRAFRQGLRDLGWVEGKNIRIEYRYTRGSSLSARLERKPTSSTCAGSTALFDGSTKP